MSKKPQIQTGALLEWARRYSDLHPNADIDWDAVHEHMRQVQKTADEQVEIFYRPRPKGMLEPIDPELWKIDVALINAVLRHPMTLKKIQSRWASRPRKARKPREQNIALNMWIAWKRKPALYKNATALIDAILLKISSEIEEDGTERPQTVRDWIKAFESSLNG